jgi:hypothetical protein
MSGVCLDSIFDLPSSGQSTTLISYANSLGRDRIVSALIRAGCDPSIYPGVKETRTVDISSHMLDLPPKYGVWLVRFIYDMIDHRAQIIDEQDASDECAACCISSPRGVSSVSCNILLPWSCGHHICIDCTWLGATRKLHATQYALRCPVCDCRCDGSENMFYLLPSPISICRAEVGVNHITLTHDQLLACSSSLERKMLSAASWAKLPPDIDQTDKLSKHARLVIPPGPIHELALHFVGTVQSQRSLEFHKAAAVGHVYRLYWLLRCGVNVDARDEYGETALIAACVRGQLESIQLLLWAGADCSIRDNCGANAFDVARCNNHSTIASLIEQQQPACASERDNYASFHIFSLNSSLMTEHLDFQRVVVTTLIPVDADHLGAGSCYIDNCFTEEFLTQLENLWAQCPETPPAKPSCSSRYYIGDSICFVRRAISQALTAALQATRAETENDASCGLRCSNVFAHMRFLRYSMPGGSLPPHEDLSRTDPLLGRVSTHTFILYLSSCSSGGETILLRNMCDTNDGIYIKPVRGRLLLFPHKCIHEGATVVDCPKLLLRGEAY